MKVTISLTVRQAAYIMRHLFVTVIGVDFNRRVNTILLAESFETQVLDQIMGTQHLKIYEDTRLRSFSREMLSCSVSNAIYPYGSKYNEVIRERAKTLAKTEAARRSHKGDAEGRSNNRRSDGRPRRVRRTRETYQNATQ
jgi:hypothetical protein